MAIIQVGGVHGVGKTTSIEAARKLTHKEAPVLKGSIIMARILGIEVEELPYQDPHKREAARRGMFEELARSKNGVRDGHFCVFTETGYEFPYDPNDIGLVEVAALLVASPETVLQRRLQIERERPTDIDLIVEHLRLEQSAAVLASQQLRIPLVIVKNEDIDSAPEQLADLFNTYLD